MGSTIFYTATTLDGFIADEHDSLDWLFEVPPGDDTEGHEARFARFRRRRRHRDGLDDVRVGRRVRALLEHPEKWRQSYGDIPAWVFSHRQLPAIEGADLRFVQGDVVAVHREMTEEAAGKDTWIIGGGDLAGQFADAGLLDEIHVSIAPATLGAGVPLLPRRLTSSHLTLASVERQGQFVAATYRLRGAGGSV